MNIKNMQIIGHSDLNSVGKGGEGFGLKALSNGERYLFLAHESGPKDFSVLNITNPSNPRLVLQVDLPGPNLRSNCMALVGDIMLVGYQSGKLHPTKEDYNVEHTGMAVFDVSDVTKPRKIGFWDAKGPASRGTHFVWCVDGEYAHLSTGTSDSCPANPSDDQMYVILDIRNPQKPEEAGRWWLPGTQKKDTTSRPIRHNFLDTGFRAHNINVYPQRPDRAYVGYIDGGVIILDITNKGNPKMLSRVDYHPPYNGFTHTALPLFNRDLMIVTDECIEFDLIDWPKFVWVFDIRDETNPVPISTFPTPPLDAYRAKGMRLGAHNIHENEPLPTSWFSDEIIVGTFFSGGVRAYDIKNPYQPQEIAWCEPDVPTGQVSTMINDLYIDERGLIYALDRLNGGLYVIEMQI